MAPSALLCSHHMVETVEKPSDFLPNQLRKLYDKKQMDYSIVIHQLKAKLCFNLLRSAVLCLRGSRTTKDELNTDFSGVEIANVIGKIKQTRFKHCFEYFSLFFYPSLMAFYFRYIFINDFVMTFILCLYTVIFYWMFFNKVFFLLKQSKDSPVSGFFSFHNSHFS